MGEERQRKRDQSAEANILTEEAGIKQEDEENCIMKLHYRSRNECSSANSSILFSLSGHSP
jgi:hypothetical protein